MQLIRGGLAEMRAVHPVYKTTEALRAQNSSRIKKDEV